MVAIAENTWYTPPGTSYVFPVKLAFVTLTLPTPQVHSDRQLTKECLGSLLDELRKYHGVNNYVWKAESQENWNIHYHIAIDKPVHWNELRDRWNRIINKLGYIDRFEEKHKHKNPNSTDIHKIKDVENVAAYISEYMAKKEGRRAIVGRDWSCSQTISRCESIKVVEDSEITDELNKIKSLKSARVKQLDYCQVLWIKDEDYIHSSTMRLAKEFRRYIQDARNEKLISKSERKKLVNEAAVDKSLIVGLALTTLVQEKLMQVEQLNFNFTFAPQGNNSIESVLLEASDEIRYKLQPKNLYTNNRTATEFIHNHSNYCNTNR